MITGKTMAETEETLMARLERAERILEQLARDVCETLNSVHAELTTARRMIDPAAPRDGG